jgi:hypothetical protein
MSQPRHITGHPIPSGHAPSRLLIWLSRAGESIIHPKRALRESRFNRRWRSPDDFDKMTPAEFETYAVKTGLAAHLQAIVGRSQGEGVAEQARADDGVQSLQGRP